MKTLLAIMFAAAVSSAADKPARLEAVPTHAERIEALGYSWMVPVKADWAFEDGILKMLVERPQEKPHRRPSQFAIADTKPWQKVTVDVEVLPMAGSLIVVYAYTDESHFNYAHLSRDDAAKVPVAHNGIFHVFGGDRVRISRPVGPPSFPRSGEWRRVRLTYDAGTGAVKVLVDGEANPAFEAIDQSLGAGKVGLGSFFETAQFRNLKITGTPAP